jgi:hypothetical protein
MLRCYFDVANLNVSDDSLGMLGLLNDRLNKDAFKNRLNTYELPEFLLFDRNNFFQSIAN